MGRARGRAAGSASMFGRILRHHLESVKKRDNYATVDQLVDHLRSTYPHYARLKLQPFTKSVRQILHSSGEANDGVSDGPNGRELKEAAPRKKRKEIDESEEKLRFLEVQHVSKRRNSVEFSHSNSFSSSPAASSASSLGSSDDEVTTSGGGGIDLTKSMLRENYWAKSKKLEGNTKVMELEVVESGRDKIVNSVTQKGGEGGIVIGKGKGGDRIGPFNENNGPKFKDFGGMNQVIGQLIEEVLVPFCRPELLGHLGLEPMTGILLHGPPGCGKTKLAHAIANEARVPFYKVSAPELVSGVSGASEENIRELFSKASRTAPSIIFIDEIDVIAAKRDNLQREMERRMVTQLMTCMDESYRPVKPVDRNEDSTTSNSMSGYVFVIGATNRPDAVDAALRRPGRFDCEFGLGVPDEEARFQILTVLTRSLKIEGALDLKKVARSTPGYVGADLVALAKNAGKLAMKRIINERKDVLSQEYCEDFWLHPWPHEEVERLRITMADFEGSVKMSQPSSKREGFSAVPNVTWDDVGGLDSLRQELDCHVIKSIKYPEIFEHFRVNVETGILLYGPPGCGKTSIAKAVANEAGANFIHVKGPELLNKYVGESELAVRTIFSRARTCSPCIIFIDEVDALTTQRGEEGGGVLDRVLAQLLLELDGAEQRRGVYVIGATNRPQVMDPALLRPGRFEKLLYVPLPSPEERGIILTTLARGNKIDASVDLMAIGKDSSCENFTGADLSKLLKEATILAMKDIWASWDERQVDSSLWTVKNEHFKRASQKVYPSVSKQQKQYYESLSQTFKSG